MNGVLQDLYETRTAGDRDGTIGDEWNRVLLWRDLERLIAKGRVVPSEVPAGEEAGFREKRYFRDVATGEIYVHVSGWERGSPEFRKLS
jgi:hypothetical protein